MVSSLTLFIGPMASGKSLLVIREIDMRRRAGIPVTVLKPKVDTRDARAIASRLGPRVEAHDFDEHVPRFRHLVRDARCIAIDEAQFVSPKLLPLFDEILAEGIELIISGLDLDFRGEPFGLMPEFAKRATKIEALTTYCAVCKQRNATRTQRLIGKDKRPAPYDSPLIQIGGSESYEARCETHHDVPGKP
ncbi:thymidine kinase [Candidatus Uhrbacteria bacterium]|nr:thymidine kinase [Candidatus Uhrbacteria bacterium]